MQLLSCHNGQLHAAPIAPASAMWDGSKSKSFITGMRALDDLLPGAAFARGAIHELLTLPKHPSPFFVALFLARAAINQPPTNTDEHGLSPAFHRGSSGVIGGSISFSGAIVWCDPKGKLYPPAVAALGVPLDRLFLLHPKTIADENWAIAECLRCRGVSATVASPRKLSRIEARRMQLAAERGGGIGILLRPYNRTANIYAAATRWLIAPARGERTVQRWSMQLIHGHGGRVGETVILEHHRENNSIQVHPLRATQQLADRPIQTPARARSA